MRRRCRTHGVTEFVVENQDTKYAQPRCLQCRTANVTRYRRKIKWTLVEEAGGRCVICGYDQCLAALQFHHLDPATKAFKISLYGRSLAAARKEATKCILVCANCHAEIEAGFIDVPSCYTDVVNDRSSKKDKQADSADSASPHPA